MYKILASLLFIFTTLSIASDDSYVFEAKGEFAKELKALVEKYSKEGKIEAKVYKKSDTVIGSLFQRDVSNIDGKETFTKKCSSCHGIKGERSPGYGAKQLNKMTRDEIEKAIWNYKHDDQYGGSGKMLMKSVVVPLREVELNSIINYLHGKQSTSVNSTQVEEEKEAPTSYLQ